MSRIRNTEQKIAMANPDNIPDMRRRLPVLRLFLVRLSSPWHSLNKDI
jgi:hypothetical protein